MCEVRRTARAIAAIPLAALLLAGCAGGTPDTLLFVEPLEYNILTCEQLAQREAAAALTMAETEARMRRAAADPAGPMINAVAYGPDYEKVRAARNALQRRMQEQNCPPAPPKPDAEQPAR